MRVLESGDSGQAAVTYATQARAAFAPFLFDSANIYPFVINDDGIDEEALATFFPPFENSMKGVIDLAFGVETAIGSCP